jgi:hypothetical protein
MPNRNQTQLSPEGAAIAQAVARKTGLQANVLAPNLRLRETGKEKPAPVIELPDLSSPAMEGRRDGPGSSSLVCNSPVGLRLGMYIQRRDGIDVGWYIVARRNSMKIWTLAYESETDCEREMKLIRAWLDDLLTARENYKFPGSKTILLTLFDPFTGRELEP